VFLELVLGLAGWILGALGLVLCFSQYIVSLLMLQPTNFELLWLETQADRPKPTPLIYPPNI
jgi:hypothetical protein